MTCDYTRMQLTVLLLQGKRKESMISKDSSTLKIFYFCLKPWHKFCSKVIRRLPFFVTKAVRIGGGRYWEKIQEGVQEAWPNNP